MMIGNPQHQGLLNVTKMLLGETGTYNDVYQRPFQTHLSGDEVSLVQEATNGFQNLTPENLSACAGQFIHPKGQPGAQVGIESGWGEQRLRFMMVVEYDNNLSQVEQVITGYTDRADLSHSGHLDPNTQFYINNVITLRTVATRNQFGMADKTQVSNNFQLLRDPIGERPSITMRPQDVFETQQASGLMEQLGDTYDGADTMFLDARRSFGASDRVRLSKRSNSVSANYMSGILEAYHDTVHDDGEYATEDMAYKKSLGKVSDELVNNHPLLRTLKRNTGFEESMCFTLREIEDLCPHVQDVMVLVRSGGVSALPTQRGATEGWGGSDNATLIANILATTIPAMATENLLTKVWFTASNDTLDGQPYCELNHTHDAPPASFTNNMDISRQLQSFLYKLKTFVMRDITHNNMINVSINVRYDMLGDTFISVACDGEPPIDYIIPTFCDALFTPMMTSQIDDLNTLSSDFQTLMDYPHGYEQERKIITQPSSWGAPDPAPQWGTPQPQPSAGWGSNAPSTPDPLGGTMFDH